MNTRAEIPFKELLEALENTDTIFPPRYINRLSDLDKDEVEQLESVWANIPTQRKRALMEDVEELCATDMLLSFIDLGLLALGDEDAKVRLLSVRTLWEYENFQFIPILMKCMHEDKDFEVRAAAAGALGKFVYYGELEEFSKKKLHNLEESLLDTLRSDDTPAVRRAALEAMGYSSRSEVNGLIEDAYASDENEWVASALFAMARSANKNWQKHVLEMLENIHPMLRSEAARAAGELEIPEAVPQLIELLDDPDQNTRHYSIWSLSQIATEGIDEILNQLYEEAEDEQEIEIIQDAVDNLEFNQEMPLMPLLDLLEDEEDNFEDIEQSFVDDEDRYIE